MDIKKLLLEANHYPFSKINYLGEWCFEERPTGKSGNYEMNAAGMSLKPG